MRERASCECVCVLGVGGSWRENFTGWWVPSEAVRVAAQAATTPKKAPVFVDRETEKMGPWILKSYGGEIVIFPSCDMGK